MTASPISPQRTRFVDVQEGSGERCPNPGCRSFSPRIILDAGQTRLSEASPEYAYQLRYCPNCGLGFVHPTPEPAILATFYKADYAYHRSSSSEAPLGGARWTLASWRYRRDLHGGALNGLGQLTATVGESLARHSISYSLAVPLCLPKNAPMLDYGVGTGGWLRAMWARGYRALHGYDVPANRDNCSRLRSDGIATVCSEILPEFDTEFACIRLEHVFEHLPQPSQVLRHLRGLLAPGGTLVMTFPSIHPWEPVDAIPDSPFREYLQLPVHLFHHSLNSATDYLAAAGFTGIRLRLLAPHGYLTSYCVNPPHDRTPNDR